MNDQILVPRTLVVDLSKRYGGSSARVLSQIAKMPHDRVALVGLEGGAITKRARDLNLPVHIGKFKKFDVRIVSWLTRLIREGDYELMDTQNVQSKLWGSLAAKRTGIALISTINSWYTAEHGANMKGRIYQAIELLTNRALDLYIVVSSDGREHLLAEGIPQDKIVLIPNAIDVYPEAIPICRDRLIRLLNLPDDVLICCAVGRLVWAKGYEVLIEAFSIITERYPQAHCLILGEGNLHLELERHISRLGLQKHIHLLGLRDPEETLSIIKSSDVFVMPSHSEATPVALLEAAALGLPILATRVGGIPDMVRDWEQALLVPPGNPTALTSGLLMLIDQPDLAARLSAGAQSRVREEFGLQSQVEATIRAYQLALMLRGKRLALN
jgi:glycosyltransferase involved in cell wall biosynthesis